MEHRVCYKKNPDNREELEREFRRYAQVLEDIEMEFEAYNERKGIKMEQEKRIQENE